MAGGQITQLIKMIDQLPEAQAQVLLKKLFVRDPASALRVLQRHFAFADLVFANVAGLDALIESLGEATLVAALAGADDALIRRFSDRFGTGKATTFIEDVHQENAAPSAVQAARRAVLTKAMFLHRRGVLTVSRPGVDS